MFMDKVSTIKLHDSTKKLLAVLGGKESTYEDIILDLLKAADGFK